MVIDRPRCELRFLGEGKSICAAERYLCRCGAAKYFSREHWCDHFHRHQQPTPDRECAGGNEWNGFIRHQSDFTEMADEFHLQHAHRHADDVRQSHQLAEILPVEIPVAVELSVKNGARPSGRFTLACKLDIEAA